MNVERNSHLNIGTHVLKQYKMPTQRKKTPLENACTNIDCYLPKNRPLLERLCLLYLYEKSIGKSQHSQTANDTPYVTNFNSLSYPCTQTRRRNLLFCQCTHVYKKPRGKVKVFLFKNIKILMHKTFRFDTFII